MYKIPIIKKNKFEINNCTQGEPIEHKIERIINNKERIDGEAPIIFTERKEGVKAAYNIRTDRFEIAIEATSKIEGSYQARREERLKNKKEVEDQSIQGKDNNLPTNPTN